MGPLQQKQPHQSSENVMTQQELRELFRRKAELEVAVGVNAQPGQPVIIRSETGQKEYVDQLVECLKARGCGWIAFDWDDPRQQRKLLLEGTEEQIKHVRPEMKAIYERWFKENGVRIALDGDEFPGLLDDTDPNRRALFNSARREERDRYFNHVASFDLSQWLVTAHPTIGWANKVYTDLPESQRYNALVKDIATCMRLDAPDPVAEWKSQRERLKNRSSALNKLEIRELHFTGPGTDLKVRLSPLAMFEGGGSVAKNGIPFIANLPTEEVFTTPDWRGTEGKVRLTRPVVINDELVSGLHLEFKNGMIVGFHADTGQAAFEAHIAKEVSARRLGEIALVGIDSRVFQTGRVFLCTLFDENAASHAAIGNAYKKVLRGGTKMSESELDAVGCNVSTSVHDDMMISDRSVDVTARTASRILVPILREGAWILPV